MTEKLYKVLHEDGTPHMGKGKWSMPDGDQPGEWMPEIEGELVPCENGYHCCTREQLLDYLNYGLAICELEYEGERLDCDDKVVVRKARLTKRLNWNERTARLFACDCTEYALSLVDQPDPRSVDAVRIARLYADGKATDEELAAAKVAAWAAARTARTARATAWAAARTAWAAARTARAARIARAAANDAANAAAWAAARKRQAERLFEYLEGASQGDRND